MAVFELRDGLLRDLAEREAEYLTLLVQQVDASEGRTGFYRGMVTGLRQAQDLLQERFKDMV